VFTTKNYKQALATQPPLSTKHCSGVHLTMIGQITALWKVRKDTQMGS